jgi:hypothetical protein
MQAHNPAGRQAALVLRIAVVVAVEEGVVYRPTADSAGVAEEAIPGLLAGSQPLGTAWATENRA